MHTSDFNSEAFICVLWRKGTCQSIGGGRSQDLGSNFCITSCEPETLPKPCSLHEPLRPHLQNGKSSNRLSGAVNTAGKQKHDCAR